MTPLEQRINSNIDRLMEEAKSGEGTLGHLLTNSYDKVANGVVDKHKLAQSRDSTLPNLTQEELRQKINDGMDAEADRLKNGLKQAAQGESTQNMDFSQFTGIAQAGSAVLGGGFLEKIAGLFSLSNFGIIQDLFSGFMAMLSGRSFQEGMQESKLNRNISKLAEGLNVDSATLKNELLKEPETAAAPPAGNVAAAQQQATGVALAGTTLDQDYSASNGTGTGAAPRTPAPPPPAAGLVPTP